MQSETLAGNAVPELGHLKAAAERISQVTYNLQTFYNRFYGATPEGNTGKDETVACYKNDLASVFEEIGRLENLTNSFTAIG